MDNNLRFQWYVVALKQFAAREGHCRVPAMHTEVLEGMEVKLGNFVSYQRQRRRKLMIAVEGTRSERPFDPDPFGKAFRDRGKNRDREGMLEAIPGWDWGPLRPGPAAKAARNKEINRLYHGGLSVKTIADQYDLSRQRVHQIVGPRALV